MITTQAADNPDSRAGAHTAYLRIEGVSKTYGDATGPTTLALGGISLDIAEGQFLAVVGLSGCGKSTLLQIVAGLIAPSTGRLEHRLLHWYHSAGMVEDLR